MIAHSVPLLLWIVIALCCAATCHAAIAALVHPGSRGASSSRREDSPACAYESVSVLKPLCGAEPRLYANLETFCVQTHPSYQLLFGVASESDPAVNVVRRLARANPERDIELVIDGTAHGSNRKVGNLINLAARAKHDVIVIADSDIAVEPDYLVRVTAPLADADVGVVTCLYRGRRVGGFWSRVGALFIDEWFAPSVHVANAGGYGRFGFGATIALRRDTLVKSGGFDALRDCLADDYWLAEHARELGLRTVLSEVVVATDVIERDLASLWRRETRWLRTIRSINPLGFAFLCLTFTTPWLLTSALLGLGFENGPDLAQSAADTLVDLSTSFGLSARLLLHFRSARSWRAFWRDLPLIPLRDALLCLQWLAALFGSSVVWRGVRIPLDDARDRYDANASDSQ
ncbi:bacteriohopanetetrol glucosamine biosynthesis glycosyltransferase HpnI [Caballeronia ptereochthonis]|uniref:Glycosyltransferase n=1 Tax=Caballeronia ptereochthonis TaxID=1777144 RepID=A0A158D5S3_9BURK|nr:bacteriohopanetetrol glucosamine biosynthesis glycosyltransferase HpnI [Caballeronia ptereochthonis]SAK89690.1 glycosyltransferase [Caballeronia ptereochthonis]